MSGTFDRPVASCGPQAAGAFQEALRTGLQDLFPRRVNAEPEHPERGLVKLILTLVELLRRLCERQALRRMDAGSLSDGEIERLGTTFMKLEEQMEELKRTFGLEGEDLNLDLGPLGDLM